MTGERLRRRAIYAGLQLCLSTLPGPQNSFQVFVPVDDLGLNSSGQGLQDSSSTAASKPAPETRLVKQGPGGHMSYNGSSEDASVQRTESCPLLEAERFPLFLTEECRASPHRQSVLDCYPVEPPGTGVSNKRGISDLQVLK